MSEPMSSTGKGRVFKSAKKLVAKHANGNEERTSLPGKMITNETLFEENFGSNYTIVLEPVLKLTLWNTVEARKKVRDWLVVCAGRRFLTVVPRIVRSGEAALYPLLVNALSLVIDVVNSVQLIPTTKRSDGLEPEEIDGIAESIALSSRQSNVESRSGAQSDVVAAWKGYPPRTLDLMDEDAVKNFIFYMENTLQSLEVPNLGHVEIVVEDSSKPSDEKKIAVVVAKPSISSDVSKRDGFYQTCASMIIYGVRYGIYTSHESWAFFRLDEAPAFDGGTPTSKGRVISRSKVFSLMKPAYDELDEQAVDIYAHLLEIFGVSPDINLVECAASSAVNQNALAEQLVGRLASSKK
jgi:hypothetical protein